MEESLSMSEGSRGTVAWIQQKASIASVFTPVLHFLYKDFQQKSYNMVNFLDHFHKT